MSPPLRSIVADGTRLSAQVWGDDGPLAILVHGFPDLPDTWDALAPRLVAKGWRVVAPYLRGYPPSEAAADCSGERLGLDVLAWADAFEAERFVVVGHDWGAMSAQAAAALAPERVTRLVTLAIPHGGAIRPDLTLLTKAHHFLTLPLPGAAGRIRRADFRPIRDIVARWAPSWTDGAAEVERTIEHLRPAGALEGALGTYRSFASLSAANRRTRPLLARPVSCPTLAFFGRDDGALGVAALTRTHAFFLGPYEQRVLDGVGHFVHREAPDIVLPAIVDFLDRPTD